MTFRPVAPSAAPSAAPPVRVRDPGELVAAVPVLLGFHPRESLVMIATGGPSGRRIGLALRVDLPPPEHAVAVVDSAVETLVRDGPAGAAVVVVGVRGAHASVVRLVRRAVAGLERRGVAVHTAVRVDATAAGARWACCDPCGCTGVLPDPSATVFAAAAAVEGRVVHAERADLERLVAPADAVRLRRREVLLVQAIAAAPRSPDAAAGTDVAAVVPAGPAVPAGPGAGAATPAGPGAGAAAPAGLRRPPAGLALLDAAVVAAAEGRLVLDDQTVVDLALALVEPAVRDAALLRCAGPAAAAAEQLWAALVRETPDPEAAEPAVLLAVSALLRGDGALAHVAVARAERAWPGHRLAGVVRSVVAAGMRPDQVRAGLRDGLPGGAR